MIITKQERGKMWNHQMVETGTNTALYQSSKTRAGQECEKMWIIGGGCPKMAGWLVKGDMGQKIWT